MSIIRKTFINIFQVINIETTQQTLLLTEESIFRKKIAEIHLFF